MVLCPAESGRDEHGTDLVAVQSGGVRFVVEARSANMYRRRDRNEPFLFGVPVEAGNRPQPPGDRRPRATCSFKMATEAPDVRPARTEQRDLSFCAPLHPLS